MFKQAIIDGMLFEVFFNSEGKIRPNEFKAHFFEDIMAYNIEHINNYGSILELKKREKIMNIKL